MECITKSSEFEIRDHLILWGKKQICPNHVFIWPSSPTTRSLEDLLTKLVTAQSFSNNLQLSCLKIMVVKFSNILNLCFLPGFWSFIMNNYWFFINLHQEKGLQISSKSPSPPTLLPAGLCTFSGERKRKNVEEDSQSEDEECFMLRLKNLSSLKLALMRKW